eukprot:6490468-Amphidinium_carterae.1
MLWDWVAPFRAMIIDGWVKHQASKVIIKGGQVSSGKDPSALSYDPVLPGFSWDWDPSNSCPVPRRIRRQLGVSFQIQR